MRGKNLFGWFRKIAFYEGISFLVLLLVAMPMKYFAGMPLAVTIIGGLHGALYVAYMILAFLVLDEYKKSFGWLTKAFLASIIPFGTFIMDSTWKKEQAALSS